ncbi:MAG: glucuronate isomerase [Chloroflexota bacterium]
MTDRNYRFFDPNPQQQEIAYELYTQVSTLPLICPHGHVDPRLFADPDYSFGTPVDMLIIPDHYVFRMLYSQGIKLEDLDIARKNGTVSATDHRQIWQVFADHYYLFRGTPTGIWLNDELQDVFGITLKLNSENAQAIYDQLSEKLATPEFNPRRLYERFNIEVLCTTDAATDTLEYHQAIRDSGWSGSIRPTFRPDNVINNIGTNEWRANINTLSQVSGVTIHNYAAYIQALEAQRTHFKNMGAAATDHDAFVPRFAEMSATEVESLFQKALIGSDEVSADDALRFMHHMLMENARMSVEDGLVMQIHNGSFRNHNALLMENFGRDMGADIPVNSEYTRNLRDVLTKYGNDARFKLILFTLNESAYSRELAPLVGHYPSLRLGPPWWFHDSLNGIRRYFDQVMETTGIYNTSGFNDDTRAFPSIPARHNLWRRASANWVAGLVVRQLVDMEDAEEMVSALSYGLAKSAYNL